MSGCNSYAIKAISTFFRSMLKLPKLLSPFLSTTKTHKIASLSPAPYITVYRWLVLTKLSNNTKCSLVG